MATLKNLTVSDNSYAQLAVGTSAERPSSPTVGMMRFNTTTRMIETYTAYGWQSHNEVQSATGGTVTTAGGYTIHTFTATGNSTFRPAYTGTVDVLVVAGGGSGAPGIGGGGGAGGLIYTQGVVVGAETDYTITVGAGGTAGPSGHGPAGNAGGASLALGHNASGGGAGAGYYSNPGPGSAPGGSGGGGPGYGYATGIRPAGAGILGQGHPGGYGVHWPGTPAGTHYGGGGGGGAGEPGYNRVGNWDMRGMPASNQFDEHMKGTAAGGDGMNIGISGGPVYYAGGGGGGVHGSYGYAYAAGGRGGGGTFPGGNGTAGAANTGGGGGGAHHPGSEQGAAGGSGIVVIRYKSS